MTAKPVISLIAALSLAACATQQPGQGAPGSSPTKTQVAVGIGAAVLVAAAVSMAIGKDAIDTTFEALDK